MRERLGAHVPGGHALQAVIPDRGGSAQSGGNIGLIDEIALLRRMGPVAGEAIGL